MRVALVHESLSRAGGAERVLEELRRAFPDAVVFSLDAQPSVAEQFPGVRTSFLQRLPLRMRGSRWALPLRPIAPETFDLSAFDVVVSSASAFAKGVVTRPGTLHICYCHAPARFLWDWTHSTVQEHAPRRFGRLSALLVLHGLRLWDHAAARRVDLFIANSETTRARIRKYYRRPSVVVYPPVRVERFMPCAEGRERGYFLFVGRLSRYKRAGLIVETFNKLELPLLIVGDGTELARLRRRARAHIRFPGRVPDVELSNLYAGARAVIFPSDDDLGLVPIEAMAAGTPVLALRRGGATETVIEGVTGEFFEEPLEELLGDCVRRFLEHERRYNPAAIRQHATNFSAERFRKSMAHIVSHAWDEWQRARQPGESDESQELFFRMHMETQTSFLTAADALSSSKYVPDGGGSCRDRLPPPDRIARSPRATSLLGIGGGPPSRVTRLLPGPHGTLHWSDLA